MKKMKAKGRKEIEFVVTDKGKRLEDLLTKHKDDSLKKKLKRAAIAIAIVLLAVMFLSMKGLL